MQKKILWVNPVGTDEHDQPLLDYLNGEKMTDTELDVMSLNRGPLHLNYHYYEALVVPDVLHLITQAEREGYHGVVIGCFYDLGLREARELSEDMMIIAPCESSLHIASSLGNSFSILVSDKKCIPKMKENVYNYGFRDYLASFESLDIGVREFQEDVNYTQKRIKETAAKAIEENMAEVIILGCTAQFGVYKKIQDELSVPIIDVSLGALKYAEFLTELQLRFGWNHSRIYGYQPPPEEELLEWDLENKYKHKGNYD